MRAARRIVLLLGLAVLGSATPARGDGYVRVDGTKPGICFATSHVGRSELSHTDAFPPFDEDVDIDIKTYVNIKREYWYVLAYVRRYLGREPTVNCSQFTTWVNQGFNALPLIACSAEARAAGRAPMAFCTEWDRKPGDTRSALLNHIQRVNNTCASREMNTTIGRYRIHKRVDHKTIVRELGLEVDVWFDDLEFKLLANDSGMLTYVEDYLLWKPGSGGCNVPIDCTRVTPLEYDFDLVDQAKTMEDTLFRTLIGELVDDVPGFEDPICSRVGLCNPPFSAFSILWDLIEDDYSQVLCTLSGGEACTLDQTLDVFLDLVDLS